MNDADDFAMRVARCWSVETASTYTADNPARGQCSVTALLAQEVLGGSILKTRVGSAWHFYNLIEDKRFDFTASQFSFPVTYEDEPSDRHDALTDTTSQQLATLRGAFGASPSRSSKFVD